MTIVTPTYANHVDSMRPTANYPDACAAPSGSYSVNCQTDNSTLTYFSQGSLSAYSRTQISSVLNNQFDPTDLNVSYENPPVYTGGAETDIIYLLETLPLGVAGWTRCDDPIDSVKCDQHYVSFASDFWAQHITCHESGHAVGLTHGAQASPSISNTDPSLACMKTADNYNSNGLGTHNIGQINGTY